MLTCHKTPKVFEFVLCLKKINVKICFFDKNLTKVQGVSSKSVIYRSWSFFRSLICFSGHFSFIYSWVHFTAVFCPMLANSIHFVVEMLFAAFGIKKGHRIKAFVLHMQQQVTCNAAELTGFSLTKYAYNFCL